MCCIEIFVWSIHNLTVLTLKRSTSLLHQKSYYYYTIFLLCLYSSLFFEDVQGMTGHTQQVGTFTCGKMVLQVQSKSRLIHGFYGFPQ